MIVNMALKAEQGESAEGSGRSGLSGRFRIRKTSILVTNDDGDSEGLRMLLEVARLFGNAHAIIPSKQRSAISGAITLHKPIRLHEVSDSIHTLSGTPADCVLFGLHSGHFPKPDLVLSGINYGDNTGLGSIIGSGTLGACWQAVLEGVPAIAFSMRKHGGGNAGVPQWGDRELLMKRTGEILEALLPRLDKQKFFTVNFPDDLKDAMVVETNRLQKERYTTEITKRLDPNGAPYYWISGVAKRIEEGTDTYEVLKKKNITVSEISLSLFERG